MRNKAVKSSLGKYLPIFISLLLFLGCEKKQEYIEDISANEPLVLNADTTQKDTLQNKIISTVILQGIKKVNIFSQTTGEIVSVNAELGKIVKASEILFEIENSVQTANLRKASGKVEEAKLNFAANQKLFEQNKISRAEFVKSQNNLFAAQAAQISAQKKLNNTKITVPFDGIITMKSESVQKGNIISKKTALFTIVDISRIKAVIPLNEEEVVKVKNGLNVELNVPAVNLTISGKITAVSSGIDSQTGRFFAEAEFENPDLMVKDGMSGIVSISLDDMVVANTVE